MGDLLTVDRQLGEGEQGGDTGGVLGGDSSVVNTGSSSLDIVMSGQLLQAAEVHNSPHSQLCPVPGHWDNALLGGKCQFGAVCHLYLMKLDRVGLIDNRPSTK